VRRASTAWLLLGLLLGGLAAERSAIGQPSKPEARAAATALFDDARKLMAAGKFAEACPKLEESLRLASGIGTLYNLADCYEKTGRTASAWTGFRGVVAQATTAGQKDRVSAARDRVKAIEPKLSRMKIEVASPVPAIRVMCDDLETASPFWGTAVPVDPGDHIVRATAPGFTPWETKVTVGAQSAFVTVEVPALTPVREPAPAKSAAPGGPLPPDAPIKPVAALRSEPSPSGSRWQVPVGITGLGLGVAGIGVSVALGFIAKSKADAAACNDKDICSQAGVDQRDAARRLGDVGTAVFIGGAVFAAGGALLLITAPSATRRDARAAWLSVTPGGVGVAGRF
jgi:hypothetical protein